MQGYSILVIEDGETSRRLLARILERSGFIVQSATSGEEGLAMAFELRPDLVVLDIMLPDIDGFEVCDRIKSDRRTRGISVIFVTALDDISNKLRGLSVGGVDYITKPFVGEEVLARIRIHLNLRRANERLVESQRQRLEALRGAQESFLTDIDSMPESRCKVYAEAAEEAGGDQYDVVQLGPSVFGYCVSDIAGHGIEVGLLSAVLKALFPENATILNTPVETFQKINVLMSDYLSDGQHITASYLVLNRVAETATILSAGHLPVLMTDPEGRVTRLKAEGDVLGAFIAPTFKPLEIPAKRGSRFWLFTDGVVENFRERRSWKAGMERLEAFLPALAALPMDQALRTIEERLFAKHPSEDDRLLLVCEV
jgi:sigma-B regulation protein RsbU (phosphoserine phosphatase)